MPVSIRGSQRRSQQTAPGDVVTNISSISVKGNAAGLIVTLVILGIGIIGLPAARWFLAAAVPAGIVFALILKLTARDR